MESVIKKLRSYDIIDWVGLERYTTYHIARVSDDYDYSCESEKVYYFIDLPMVLTPEDIVLNIDSTHIYSFSFVDVDVDADEINFTVDSDANTQVFVYDHTALTVCKVDVELKNCSEDLGFSIAEMIEVNIEDGEIFKNITMDDIDLEIDNECGAFVVKFDGNENFGRIYTYQIGTTVAMEVEVHFDDGTNQSRTVSIDVLGEPLQPIKMYIEDKEFVTGETVVLRIWSERVENLVAWQFDFVFENVEIVGVGQGEVYSLTYHNVLSGTNILRSLWSSGVGKSIEVENEMTWFTIEILPNFDGSTSDIFSIQEENSINNVFLEHPEIIISYEIDFDFDIVNRGVVSASEAFDKLNVTISPNPSTGFLFLEGLTYFKDDVQINIYDRQGLLVRNMSISSNIESYEVDISTFNSGLYFIEISDNDRFSTYKIFKK